MKPLREFKIVTAAEATILAVLICMISSCATLTPGKVESPPTSTPPQNAMSNTPYLRINSKMHNSIIRRIDVDANDVFVVSASDDKSVKLWLLETGELLDTIRLPAAPGGMGKAFAVAISPDGRSIAVGGETNLGIDMVDIYIFDRESGRMTNRIGGLPENVTHLVYSTDGEYLVATMTGDEGIRIFDSREYRLRFSDTEYGARSYWCDFDNSGRLVTASYDRKIRLYNNRFQLINELELETEPFGVAISPDGERIAVGFYEQRNVGLYSGRNLTPLPSPDMSGIDNGRLSTVSWSTDGETLYAGGTFRVNGTIALVSWGERGNGKANHALFGDDIIMGIKSLKNGSVVVGSGDPALALLDNRRQEVWRQQAAQVEFSGQVERYGIRSDVTGHKVVFSKRAGGAQVEFDLRTWQLGDDISTDSVYAADTESLPVDYWQGYYKPQLDGKELRLRRWETARSLAISRDQTEFVLGADWSLRWYNVEGNLLSQKTAPSEVYALTISGDGRWLIAGLGDGSIRWYEYRSGEERLALYVDAATNEWVAWTPPGFFSSSANGQHLIGYLLNNGFDKAPDYVISAQLYDSFYRPDLVLAHFEGDEYTVQQALSQVGDIRNLLKRVKPPLIELAKNVPTTVQGALVTIPLKIVDQGSGVGALEIRVNGVLQQAKAYVAPGAGSKNVQIAIPPGEKAKVSFRAGSKSETGKGVVFSKAQVVEVLSLQSGNEERPVLRGLAIGIEKYRDQDLTLPFTSNDVVKLLDTLDRYSSPLFDDIKVEPLTDAPLEVIKAAFNRIPGEVSEEDVFLLYLSGHGVAMDGEFFFLPQDFIYNGPGALQERAVTQDMLIEFMSRIPANKLIFIIDSCFAGSFDAAFSPLLAMKGVSEKTAIDRLMQSSGRAGFYASSKKQVALTGYKNQSLYTGILLEGLEGAADNGDRNITLNELAAFLEGRVPEVSKEIFGIEIFPMSNVQGSFPLTRIGN